MHPSQHRGLTRRDFLAATAAATTFGLTAAARAADDPAATLLPNGIRLPADWPPRGVSLPLAELPTPPYLVSPPDVIPIDTGRQLLVDDFLVAESTLERTYHSATYHPATPVLKPDQPWETGTIPNPTAMPFSDGAFYDPKEKRFKLWYMGGHVRGTCLATSDDGIHWTKPRLDVVAGTNIVLGPAWRDSSTVWLDDAETDAERRYKLGYFAGGAMQLFFSADGVHWNRAGTSGPTGDRSTFFYNPFRKKWVFSIRADVSGGGRVRRYHEGTDFLEAARWSQDEAVPWVGADRLDPERSDLKTRCQLYNLDCVAYESLMLGLFTIWRGQPRDRAKPNELCVGFSRDGFHWHRPERKPFIPVSEEQGDWNWGNVQSAGGCCLVVGDELYFYVSGRGGVPGSTASGTCTTGLATLRRDGFASLDAGDAGGSLTTRPVRFRGRFLFVNAAVPRGELRAEVLDASGRVIAPFSRENCIPLREDRTRSLVAWKGQPDLAGVAGRPVRFRFHLAGGRLYAFWVSPSETGASLGYVAAGGPGFGSMVDEVS